MDLDGEGADEPPRTLLVGKDANDIGAALDLLIEPLKLGRATAQRAQKFVVGEPKPSVPASKPKPYSEPQGKVTDAQLAAPV